MPLNVPIFQDLINRARIWKLGVHRLTVKEIDRLQRIRHQGLLVEAIPSREDKPELSSIVNFLIPVHNLLSTKLFSKPVAFEIWSYRNRFSFYFFSKDREAVQQIIAQLNAIYPNAVFKQAKEKHVRIKPGYYLASAIVQVEDYLYQIKNLGFFDYDPLSHILEAMSSDSMLQVIFKAEKISNRLISKVEAEESLSKLSLLCFRTLIRIVAISSNPFIAKQAAEQIASAFSVFNANAYFKAHVSGIFSFINSYSILKKLVKRSFPWFFQIERKDSFILSAPELASIVHLPIDIRGISLKQSSAENSNQNAEDHRGIAVGYVKFRGKPIEKVFIPTGDLSRHVYIIGATGTGKSSLLINMISQAQKKGICVHVIDPHGDMAYELVECLGKQNLENIVFLDPFKVRFSINPFELPPYANRYERSMVIEKIIGQIVEWMKRIFGKRYWGPSLNRTFQNAIRLLYKRDDSPTFEDILDVLLGKTEKLGALARNHELQDFLDQLSKIPRVRTDAVINKVDPFVKNALLRMIFCNKESTLNFKELLQPGKVVVWRLSKAELTEQNMQMIGSAIITKLWFHCASRPRNHRNPVLLVIDEFQNFAQLETLEVMITEARKFGVGLILSHQHTKQLPENVLSEVLGNTATKIIFRVSGEDSLTLARSLDISSARMLSSDLTSLPDGSAIVKLRAKFGEEAIAPFEIFTLKPMERKHVDFTQLLNRMEEKYSAPAPPQLVRIQTAPKIKLDEELTEFLEIVDSLGIMGMAKISRILGIRPSKLKEQIKKAESLGLVETFRTKTGGRPRRIMYLTAKGKELKRSFLGREGSLLHRKAVERISKYCEKEGAEVEIPLQGGRKPQADLIAKFENETIAIEVETRADHPEQMRKNYEKNLGKYDRIIFVGIGKNVVFKIKKILGPSVEVYDFFDFLENGGDQNF